MNNIMKLADAYAEKCADVREYLGGNAGIDEADPYWVAMKEAEAALEAAVDQLEKDAKRYRWFADIAVNGTFDKAEAAFACFEHVESCTNTELDAAIDAAMEAK